MSAYLVYESWEDESCAGKLKSKLAIYSEDPRNLSRGDMYSNYNYVLLRMVKSGTFDQSLRDLKNTLEIHIPLN